MISPILVFIHCPHSFLLQLKGLVLVIVVGGGGSCYFGIFIYFLWANGYKPL